MNTERIDEKTQSVNREILDEKTQSYRENRWENTISKQRNINE